jgi:hypothetical protein
MQPMSRALRPGVTETTNPTRSKSPAFDLGSLKGPSTGPKTSTGKKPPARIGKGVPDSVARPKVPRGFGRGR